jgi:oligoendopeptidase F
VRLRGYASPIGVRNVANDVPDAAIDTMLEVVAESVPLFQRYFRRKAEWLRLPRLRRYDLYAPLGTSDQRVEWSEAVATVVGTFAGFHPLLGEHARRVFEEDHIDAQPRPGKKGGAFCSTVLPKLTPWVLVNYSGRLRDVATLAHELGHAVHGMLASEHSVLVSQASLPLAETASVFSEILTMERLLAERPEPVAQRELLAAAIDDIYATVVRQAYFVRFEREAHAAILAGAKPEQLSEMYFGLLEEQFGDAIELAPEFRQEWIMIPHIYSTPFYCYAYSFGQLLVLALYRRYQNEGEAFKPGYLRLLAAGGSARPQEILQGAGVDITDRAFWRGGVSVIQEMVERLESL